MEVIPDGVATPIADVACRYYGLLMRLASRVLDCYRDWMQARFTTRELITYPEGPIRTRQETPTLRNLPESFQGHLAVAALQCAFPGHYLTDLAAPPATTDTSLFKLMHPPPIALCMNLACLRGDVGNAESSSDNNTNDAADLQPNAHTNSAIADTYLPCPSAAPSH